MSKKGTIILLVVVAVVAVLYFMNKDGSDTSGMPAASASPSAGANNTVQGTGTVTYNCAQGTSFVMAFANDNTARLTGTGLTPMTLTKTAVDYWVSTDGKTVVKPAGGYIVLVQNDKTIRDLCAKK